MKRVNHDLHKRPGYADPSPYPEIKVQEKNKYYAELLLNDYSGVVSEMTAINQYLYHHFVLADIDEEVAEMLENIAITEMHHMEILADLIQLLGVKPIFRYGGNKSLNFWNSEFVYYGNNICDQLEANIRAEHDAIKGYRRHIELIDDPYIKAILARIILDEQVHIPLFEKAIQKHKCSI